MKRGFKLLLSGLLLVSVIGCARVQGVVRDEKTLSPIPSAIVTVPRLSKSASTNAMGKYDMTGLFILGDTIMVNAPGYNIYTESLKSMNEIKDINLVPKN